MHQGSDEYRSTHCMFVRAGVLTLDTRQNPEEGLTNWLMSTIATLSRFVKSLNVSSTCFTVVSARHSESGSNSAANMAVSLAVAKARHRWLT